MFRIYHVPDIFTLILLDFNWAIGISRIGLNVFGIWPGIGAGNANTTFRPLWMTLIMTMLLIYPLICAMSRVVHELPLVLDNLITSSTTILGCIKISLFWMSENGLQPVLGSMENDWKQTRLAEERKVMVREGRRGRLLTIFSYSILTVAMCGILVLPLFGLSVRTLSNLTDVDGYLFPVQSCYPYEYTKRPHYQLTYLTQTISCLYFAFAFTVVDTFFAVIIFHTCGQVEIFGMRLQNLSFNTWKGSMLIENLNQQYRKWIKDAVDTHIHLIWIVNKIERTFSMIIFVQLISVSIVIGLVGIQVLNVFQSDSGTHTTTLQLIFRLGSLFEALLLAFIYCFAGERLAKNSKELAYCIYSCKWYSLPPKVQTDLLLIIQRSNEPLKITAGKFILLSLRSFSKILNTSAGYISMIIAVRSDS